MKSVKFKESTIVFAKGDPVYETHVYMDQSIRGEKDIVVCYKLNFWERLLVLITGRIWLTQTTYNGKLLPLWLTTLKKQLLTTRKQRRDMEKKRSKMGVPKMDNPPPPPKKKLTVPPPGEKLSIVK